MTDGTITGAMALRSYDALATPSHGWVVWRWAVLNRMLRTAHLGSPRDSLRVLDYGAGDGVIRCQALESGSAWKISTVDPRLPSDPLTGLYDGALLLDVMEHVLVEADVLRACADRLTRGGWLVVNVPARQELFCWYDEIQGHHRRYDRDTLSNALLTEPRLRVVDMQYWGVGLLPFAWARRWRSPVYAHGFDAPRWAHRVVRWYGKWEARLAPRPWLGTSLMALLMRVDNTCCAPDACLCPGCLSQRWG